MVELNACYFELFYFASLLNNWNSVVDTEPFYFLDLVDYNMESHTYLTLELNKYIFNNFVLDSVVYNKFQSNYLIKQIVIITSTDTYFEFCLFLIKATFFLFILVFLWLLLGDNFIKNYSKIKIFKTLIKEVDQEFSNFEDYFFWFFVISSTIIYSSNYISIVKVLAICLYTYTFLIIATVFFIPFYITFVFFNDLSSKIKGYSNEESEYVHTLLDYMTFTAFCLRFILQCIRWFLIVGTYMFFHEYFFEMEVNPGIKVFNNMLGFSTENMYKDNLGLKPFSIFRIIFEYLDVLFVALIQTIAFFVVILWLFNFLFSYSNKNLFECFLYFRQDHEKKDK